MIDDDRLERVRSLLANALAPRWPVVGLCSLADGADQMFAEMVLAANCEFHAIVPSADFEDTLPLGRARTRYRELRDAATSVEVLPQLIAHNDAFMDVGALIVQRSDLLLAVWDGMPARGEGGTGTVVALAQALGRPYEVIWPSS